MGLLEKMYRGKISYFGEIHIKNPDYKEAGRKMIKAEEKLIEEHPEIKELFEEYQAAHSEVTDIAGYEKFALGFRIGAQLMKEMLEKIE